MRDFTDEILFTLCLVIAVEAAVITLMPGGIFPKWMEVPRWAVASVAVAFTAATIAAGITLR